MSTDLDKRDVDQFIDLISQSTEGFIKAGELAATAIARNPEFIDLVCDKCPDITPEFMRRMEMVGLKRLHPAWLINQSPGARRIARLSYAIQEKYATVPVELMIEEGKSLMADVRNLQPDQAKQVIAEDHIRSLAEQRTYMSDKLVKKTPSKKGTSYEVKNGKLLT